MNCGVGIPRRWFHLGLDLLGFDGVDAVLDASMAIALWNWSAALLRRCICSKVIGHYRRTLLPR